MTVASQVKQTLANLKGTQSTLRIYSIQAQDEKAKYTYREAIKITNVIIKDLEQRLSELQLEEPQYKH